MKRIAMAVLLKDDPEVIRKYEEYHANQWPEVRQCIVKDGIRRGFIYRFGCQLFMFIEAEDDFDMENGMDSYKSHPKTIEWDKIMSVNLRGTFLMCKYFLKVMVKNKRSNDSPIKGKIINVASMRGKIPKAKMAAYSASKAGVIALTKSLALELGPRRITVNAVCPGTIFTAIWGKDKKPEDVEGFGGQVPLKYKKVGMPEDVAGLICFLASKDADWITGNAFRIAGGMIT